MKDCREAKIIEFHTLLFVSAGGVLWLGCKWPQSNGDDRGIDTVCIVIGAECNVFV